jgi:hypothetical protein
MDLLIRFFAVINRRTDISNVANYNCLHISIVECGDKFGRLFVLDVLDLIIQFC